MQSSYVLVAPTGFQIVENSGDNSVEQKINKKIVYMKVTLVSLQGCNLLLVGWPVSVVSYQRWPRSQGRQRRKELAKVTNEVLSLVRVNALLLSVVETESGLVDPVAAVETDKESLFS